MLYWLPRVCVLLIAGILILIVPSILNYVVAIWLIVFGIIGLFGLFGGAPVPAP